MAGIRNIGQQGRLAPPATAVVPPATDHAIDDDSAHGHAHAARPQAEGRPRRSRVPLWALALQVVAGVLLIALGVLFTTQRGDDAPAVETPASQSH